MTEVEVTSFARMVRRVFAKRGSPGDLDDAEQAAAVSLMETHRRTGIPLPGNRRYHFTGAARDAGLCVSREISSVSFPKRLASRAREWQDRTQLVGCGNGPPEDGAPGPSPVDLPGGPMPDARIRRGEVDRARGRLWITISRHVRRFPDGDRRVLELLFGIGTDPAEDSAEVAWRSGRSHSAILSALRRFAAALRADEQARALRDVMIAHMEDS